MEFKNSWIERTAQKVNYLKYIRLMKQFKFTINDHIYNVTVNKIEDAVAEIEVNGASYKVFIDKPVKQKTGKIKRPVHALKTVTHSPPTEVAHPAANASVYAVRSPLPGVILSVDCKVGDKVKKGQHLLVLEAMKMENSIPADYDGKIIEIKVKAGDSVMESADLVIIK